MKIKGTFLVAVISVIMIMMSVTPITANELPLDLPWGQPITHPSGRLILPSYKYVYGDPEWGQVRYVGSEDIHGMSSELIVYYANKKLSSVLLILGSSGLNETNCVKKYKEMVAFLNKKYGHFKYQSHTVDPDIEDLIFSKRCHAIKVGMEDISTRWKLKRFRIESFLFGDSGELFIEIEYILLSLEKEEKEANIKRVIKRL